VQISILQNKGEPYITSNKSTSEKAIMALYGEEPGKIKD
jgi:hypothetical protein